MNHFHRYVIRKTTFRLSPTLSVLAEQSAPFPYIVVACGKGCHFRVCFRYMPTFFLLEGLERGLKIRESLGGDCKSHPIGISTFRYDSYMRQRIIFGTILDEATRNLALHHTLRYN